MMVFVSYQRSDTLFAAHMIGYALRSGGHVPFVDTGSIEGGEVYANVIGDAIAAAHVMVALIGPQFSCERLNKPDSAVAFEWRRARARGPAVVPLLVDSAVMPSESALPVELRWFARRNAYALRQMSLSADVDKLVAAIPSLSIAPRPAARVLWIDDRPANNELERRTLRADGIVFDNVVSSAEAIDQLENETYDLIITDLGREGSSDHSSTAGADLLKHPVIQHRGPPVIVYAGFWAVKARLELIAAGALDVMASREQLYESVRHVLGLKVEEDLALQR